MVHESHLPHEEIIEKKYVSHTGYNNQPATAYVESTETIRDDGHGGQSNTKAIVVNYQSPAKVVRKEEISGPEEVSGIPLSSRQYAFGRSEMGSKPLPASNTLSDPISPISSYTPTAFSRPVPASQASNTLNYSSSSRNGTYNSPYKPHNAYPSSSPNPQAPTYTSPAKTTHYSPSYNRQDYNSGTRIDVQKLVLEGYERVEVNGIVMYRKKQTTTNMEPLKVENAGSYQPQTHRDSTYQPQGYRDSTYQPQGYRENNRDSSPKVVRY
jgi:hypothetical protein